MNIERPDKIMRNIDATTSSFEALITNKLVYVDKTDYLYSLVRKGVGYYFLSRPRRFGKSLTVSTLEAIFKGKKELFKDLYIGQVDYDFKVYPVIHIDFGNCIHNEPRLISKWLSEEISLFALQNKIGIEGEDYAQKFRNLIYLLNQTKGKVVILVDEYDKLLSSNITNIDRVTGIRDVLRGFFEVIKASYDYIRFVFITGVTKYSKMSIFSSMNNLFDLSVNEDYGAMLGYTQEELEHYFAPGIEEGMKNLKLSREEYLEKIKTWYDGYLFAPGAERVYNPVSIGSFFDEKGKYFRNYWARTGGTQLLYDVAKRTEFNVETDIEKTFDLETIQSHDIVGLASTDVSKHNYNSLLFQTGYLTIKDYEEGDSVVGLGFPNEEVSRSFATMILPLYATGGADKSGSVFLRHLRLGDTESFGNAVKAVFAGMPYNISGNYEYSFQTGFYCIMKSMGANILAEVPTNKGRIDAVVETDKHIYIFEFKVEQSAIVAIEQIKAKGYADKYKAPEYKGRTIHLVGVSFSREGTQILFEDFNTN